MPVDLLMGHPPDDSRGTANRSEYAGKLLKRMETVHRFARQHLKHETERQKRYYDHRGKGAKTKPKVVHHNRLKPYEGTNAPTWLDALPTEETTGSPKSGEVRLEPLADGYEVDLVENVNEVINREDFEGIQPWTFEPQGPDLGAEEKDEERMADDVPMEDIEWAIQTVREYFTETKIDTYFLSLMMLGKGKEEVLSMNCAANNLNGDGRCDSPGHNAKYSTYTFMDSDSEKVVSFSVVPVTEVTSSNAMEKEGFVKCLDSLEDDDVSISCITTDRHISIASTMGKDYSHIDHQFDVWHLSKSVVKILNKKAKLKQCQDLSHWIQSASNHLWWSAATCNGDVQLLREKWVSVLHHVWNKDTWNDAEIFLQCAHPRLNRREVRRKCWLEPGSAAYVALEEVVLKPKLLKDLAKLTNFCHTGGLEVYHSMMLKYCPKRQHFSNKGMVARTQLAAIDNNHNTDRNQAVIQKGERSGEARYRQCFP
ncbi:hypothetical protein QZH41_005084 [Actinostola sp. cb2023]|nr:hypothetical protein QZH41_005084 [Actinostola sp. cb2023]